MSSLDDLRLAPFQVLAGSAGTCLAAGHTWHMKAAERLAAADPVVMPTRHIVADLAEPGAEAAVTAWWEQITGAGGEGMVAKPATPLPAAGAASPSRG